MRPLNDGHLYLAKHATGMPYYPIDITTPRLAGSGSSRRRDNDGSLLAHRTNSQPQILAPSVTSSSSSLIITEPPGMQTDSPHNAGVLHPVEMSHPLAPTLPTLGPVSTMQSNVRIPIRR